MMKRQNGRKRSARRRLRLAAAIAVVVAHSGGATTALAGLGDATGGGPATPDASASPSASLVEQTMQRGFDKVMRRINARFARRLGIVEMAPAQDGLNVPLVDLNDRDRRTLARWARKYGIALHPIEALVSHQELLVLKDQVIAAMRDADSDADWAVGIDGDSGTVELVAEQPDLERMMGTLSRTASAFAAALAPTGAGARRASLPSDLLTMSAGSIEKSDLRDGYTPRSGSWIGVGNSICTLGFIAQIRGTNRYAGVSAGHCAGATRTGDSVIDRDANGNGGSMYYGSVDRNTYADMKTDALRFPLAFQGWWDGNARVLWQSNGWRTIIGKTPDRDQVMNMQMCGAGWGINHVDHVGEKCGPIKKLNYTFSSGGIRTPNLNCFEKQNHGGDSGGPVYNLASDGRAYAAGITDSGLTTGAPTHHYWCYDVVDSVESALGVDVLTNKP